MKSRHESGREHNYLFPFVIGFGKHAGYFPALSPEFVDGEEDVAERFDVEQEVVDEDAQIRVAVALA